MPGGAYFRADKCHVCRKRKIKCGGERPSCLRCLHSNLTCTGYQRPLDIRLTSTFELPETLGQRRNGKQDQILQSIKKSPDASVARKSAYSRPFRQSVATPSLHSTCIWVRNASQHRAAFLGTLLQLYFPNAIGLDKFLTADQVLVPAVCSTWLYSACNLVPSQGANTLSNALLALTLAVAAAGSSSAGVTPDMMMRNALDLYGRSLRGLGSQLRTPPASWRKSNHIWSLMSLTCLACSSFEASSVFHVIKCVLTFLAAYGESLVCQCATTLEWCCGHIAICGSKNSGIGRILRPLF